MLIDLFDSEMNVAGRRFWNFPIFAGDCGGSLREELPDRIYRISESCSQMALQFHSHIEVTSYLPNYRLPPFSFNIVSRSKRLFILSLSLENDVVFAWFVWTRPRGFSFAETASLVASSSGCPGGVWFA
jgi:hypothetical protein